MDTIPVEVWYLILTQLDPLSQSQTALLSHSMHRLVIPHLYRSPRLTTRTSAHALHRTLHLSPLANQVKSLKADVGQMARTSSAWQGWFLYHALHSLVGILSATLHLRELSLFLPIETGPWTNSLTQTLALLPNLTTLTKDLIPTPYQEEHDSCLGSRERLPIPWRIKRGFVVWSLETLLVGLEGMGSLERLRLAGLSSDSVTSSMGIGGRREPSTRTGFIEVVLVEIKYFPSPPPLLLGVLTEIKVSPTQIFISSSDL